MNKLKLKKKKAGLRNYKFNSKSESDCITFIKKRFGANLIKQNLGWLFILWGGFWLIFKTSNFLNYFMLELFPKHFLSRLDQFKKVIATGNL